MKYSTLHLTRKGFTLIELIIVIAILGTLAAIGYPAIMSAVDKARVSTARKQGADIVQAVKRFGDDYNGMLPINDIILEPNEDDEYVMTMDGGNDGDFLAILTNREKGDDRINSERNQYLPSDLQDSPSDGLFENTSGELGLFDPWGSPYGVVLSLNMENNKGAIDPFTGDFSGKQCLVYSLGPDEEGKPQIASRKPANNRGSRPARGARKNNAAAADAAADYKDSIEDNVYSWKTISK